MKIISTIFKESNDESQKIIRHVVRGVVHKDGKYFLFHNKKHNEYTFPGIEIKSKDEVSKSEMLRDSLKEIVGTKKFIETTPIGIIEEFRPLKEAKGTFNQFSYYYLLEVGEFDQEIMTHRMSVEFKPEWVTIQKAITLNSKIEEKEEVSTAEVRALHMLKYLEEGNI